MAKLYIAYNGAMPTTAALASIATGNTIKTLMQISTPATLAIRVCEWGISFDAVNATPVKCELVQTDVAATVTQYAAADVMPYNDPNAHASLVTLGTANSGFTSSGEGSTTATRIFDYQLVAQSFVKQFPLGREPELPLSKFLRVRVTAAVTSNAICYVVWEE